MTKLYDSHAHLDDPAVAPAAMVAQLRWLAAHGWSGALIPGYWPDRFVTARELAAAMPLLVRAVGLHPEALAKAADDAARELAWQGVLAELDAPRVRAIGEIGLDKRCKDSLTLPQQLDWFRRGLELARARGLPVVLHVVGWHGHALDLLRELPPPGGVVHRWSGPLELVAGYQAVGLHISLSLEPRDSPARRQAVAAAIASERLLIETDWPFLELDYPDAVAAMAQLLADVAAWRGESTAELAPRLVAQARAVYGV